MVSGAPLATAFVARDLLFEHQEAYHGELSLQVVMTSTLAISGIFAPL
jgi:hypothetical protein